jgi:hypothetical protein
MTAFGGPMAFSLAADVGHRHTLKFLPILCGVEVRREGHVEPFLHEASVG